MTSESWRRELAAEKQIVEASLRRELRDAGAIPHRLRQAMAHSLLSGGKRLRPILLLWTWDALTAGRRLRREAVRRDTVCRAAAAIELLHTYSLIHDDLPAMDDDVMRRGRPTCHVVFGEGTAILAGDALQALAFEILAHCGPRAATMAALAARAAGPAGMVGGQQLDLQAEGTVPSAVTIRRIHDGKTAAMIALALALGAVCSAAPETLVIRLQAAGRWLGLAFQGADDLLDATASSEVLGKTCGKDAASGKATWIRREGLAAARARTQRDGRRGLRALAAALPGSPASARLLSLARLMYQREF